MCIQIGLEGNLWKKMEKYEEKDSSYLIFVVIYSKE